jgi:phthiocerol/phenolphthiocerol synthesis type-I polyketide synthase E
VSTQTHQPEPATGTGHNVAVVGMACRFPGADGVEEFWGNLLEGRDTIARPDVDGRGEAYVSAVGKLDGTELFDAEHFKITPGEAATMDPQQRVLLEAATAAMEDAGYGRGEATTAPGPVVGVFVGGGESEYLHEFVAPATGCDPYDDLRLRSGNGKDFLAARVAFKLGLSGPSITVQAGCATGLVAVATACNSLMLGDCDVAIAGGVSLVMPDVDGYDHEPGGILSVEGYCRPFDRLATGTVPSSGVGVVILKRDDDAVRDRDARRAVLAGWAVNNDGGSRSGFTVPNVAGQSRVVRRALDRSGLGPGEVGFIETHGTATAVGDAVELEALREVFGTAVDLDRACLLGATKANIGHTDAAAGVAGLIKAVLVVERGLVPPLAHFTELHESLDLAGTPFVVPTKVEQWPRSCLRVAGVSSFGLGGNNAHVVLREAPATPPRESPAGAQVIALSADTPAQLERLRAATRQWFLDQEPLSAADLADAAFTLAAGRRDHTARWAVAVDDRAAATLALAELAEAPRRTLRFELIVAGSPEPILALASGELAAQPAYQRARARLERDLGDGGTRLGAVENAALTVLAVTRCLENLGVDLARVDGPGWVWPALAWHVHGDDRAEPLTAALAACKARSAAVGGAAPHVGESVASAGHVVLDAGFSLPRTVASAWQSGASVRLEHLHDSATRRRRSMPTYPFARREHWFPRTSRAVATPDAVPSAPAGGEDGVAGLVTRIWCEVLGLERIDPNADFVNDLGGDSMYAVEIGGQLNDRLGLDLPIDLPFEAPTINLTVAAVTMALTEERPNA